MDESDLSPSSLSGRRPTLSVQRVPKDRLCNQSVSPQERMGIRALFVVYSTNFYSTLQYRARSAYTETTRIPVLHPAHSGILPTPLLLPPTPSPATTKRERSKAHRSGIPFASPTYDPITTLQSISLYDQWPSGGPVRRSLGLLCSRLLLQEQEEKEEWHTQA